VLPVISNFVPVSYEGYVKNHIPSKYCCAWGGFGNCVIGGVNGPCSVVEDRGCTGEFSKKKIFSKTFSWQYNVVDMVCPMNIHHERF
jgi:hypothetical protein